MMPPAHGTGTRAQGGGPAETVGVSRGVPGQVAPRHGRRWRLLRQEPLPRSLCRPLRPHPAFQSLTQSRAASLHLLPHTPSSAGRNYRIAGARLMRSNYPPPLSSQANARQLGRPSLVPELSPGPGALAAVSPAAASCRPPGLPPGPH
ncbi:PREDICTED: LOW QUALITY PROTEIN: uncharacterized protein C6orf223 homolog [Myotis brandtii]|uniref:LOW QUALITY PROTEIN: uncharacterized protein C6orf223 homolog n=1 Tax=Myotis brandtii TaxID=109478 RepID=UPI0003BBC3F8|nr:PREDICTED: LOW QUALITY PROTEIN: uncharacterized protein C6orf223 homolog [Myotis brandtii]